MTLEKALALFVANVSNARIESAAPNQKIYCGCHPSGVEAYVIKNKRNLNQDIKTTAEVKAEIDEQQAAIADAWKARLS